MSLPHRQDSDCTVDPETGCCIECGVGHGDPCLSCSGRGYHTDDCAELYHDSPFREYEEGWYENEEGTLALSHPVQGYEEKTGAREVFRLEGEDKTPVRLYAAATRWEAEDWLIHGGYYGTCPDCDQVPRGG
jgi:hypothetical protein